MSQTVLIVLICLLLLAFGIWKEIRRAAKAYVWLRVLATVMGVAALACIILPISYSSTISHAVEHEAVLLTEGFDADSLAAYPHMRVYTLEKSIRLKEHNAVWLTDAGSLTTLQPQITQIHILGYGLTAGQLAQINQIPVIFHPPTLSGIAAVNHTAQLVAGHRFEVQGSYHNNSTTPVKLLLKGIGTLLDSVNLPANAQTSFHLTTIPKHSGRATYRLLVLKGTDTLEQQPLPLTIEPAKPLKVLMLAATPDFENKFLKNWLAENGYAAAIRTGISKGKTSMEFVGMDKFSLNYLPTSALRKFDVVTADLAALKALTPAENAVLHQQVTQQGLGLVIRADSGVKAAGWLQGSFPVSVSSSAKAASERLTINGAANPTSPLIITPAYISYQPNTQPLITDQQNRILASSNLTGAGKVVFTTLTPTFSWALAGNTKDYTAVWTSLLTKAARKLPAIDRWAVTSSLPLNGAPAEIRVQTAAQPQGISINETLLAPMQNAALPFEWSAHYWPQADGWQQARANNNASFAWYAYSKNDWQPLQASEKIQATQNYAANHAVKTAVTKQIQQKIRIEVPKIYFYVLLLLACSFLWAESRWLS